MPSTDRLWGEEYLILTNYKFHEYLISQKVKRHISRVFKVFRSFRRMTKMISKTLKHCKLPELFRHILLCEQLFVAAISENADKKTRAESRRRNLTLYLRSVLQEIP